MTATTQSPILYLADGRTVRAFTKVGGYPVYYLTSDALVICPGCVQSEYLDEDSSPVAEISGHGINYEQEMHCDACGSGIESAYGITGGRGEISPARWPGIVFTDRGAERLGEVSEFLDGLLRQGVDAGMAGQIYDEFISRMDYLNGYGGQPGDPNKRYWVELSSDFTIHSFSILWRRQGPDGPVVFNGGLIWHGGSNETFTVSLTRQWWGIHT